MEKRTHPTPLLSSILPGKADPTQSRIEETGGSVRVRNKRPPAVIQLALPHSFVMWQAGREDWETLGFIFFIFHLFFCWKLRWEDNFWQGK